MRAGNFSSVAAASNFGWLGAPLFFFRRQRRLLDSAAEESNITQSPTLILTVVVRFQ